MRGNPADGQILRQDLIAGFAAGSRRFRNTSPADGLRGRSPVGQEYKRHGQFVRQEPGGSGEYL